MTLGGIFMTGRRWLVVGVTTLAVMIGVAGCGLPDGVDGKLADKWAMPPAAQQVATVAGECHVGGSEQVMLVSELTVDCAKSHTRETTYVGEFTGAVGGLAQPPLLTKTVGEPGLSAQAAAYAECDKQTSAYLGHKWYDMRLRLEVVMPNDTAWKADRRWYRCELSEVNPDNDSVKAREGSLKGVIFPVACMSNPVSGRATLIACTTKHNAEYAGSFLNPMVGKEPTTTKDYAPIHTRCRALIATYLGTTAAQVQYMTGTSIWWDYDYEYWSMGRRVVHCALWFNKKTMIGSAKGRHGRNLP
jgi:hypothetical protein